jgi:hypothetical protein
MHIWYADTLSLGTDQGSEKERKKDITYYSSPTAPAIYHAVS